jgi:SAM-dependent methyltransferase
MSEISGRVAEAVREFYEEHPYPPPIEDLDGYRQSWEDLGRRRAEYHLLWPGAPYREDRSVLVAGCGTSQAAKHALRWPQGTVVGVDFSATSIGSTEKLKRRYGLDNLELHALPIERVGELGHGFDHIVCTGVLHHLADPDVGLSALREVLEPGGTMSLMVYAPYGRAGIYLLQDYCRRLGLGTSPAAIADLGSSLRALPPDHPIVPLLRDSPDFESEVGLADALLNPRDRAYSVPELLAFLERNGLRLGRWVRQAPYLPFCGALLNSPHQALLANLPANEQYAALELFRGTMMRHSAIVYRADESSEPQPIRFEGDEWLDYVPIRLARTICVEERLPPTAAGVLINPAHSYRDLYLPIDAVQKRQFEAIDGSRSIGEIATTSGQRQIARTLFERLWWYDQVVFAIQSCASRS